MIKIQSFTFNPFQENTFVLYDETNEALIIDPGCYERHEKHELIEFISSHNLVVKYLLNTHCHIDHVLGNAYIKEKYKVPFLIHKKEEPVLKAVKSYASNYGFAQYAEQIPDGFMEEGDVITWGTSKLNVVFLPGHAPGHVGFYNANQNFIIGGDVLFRHSIGRTDLPGGDFDTLINSIHQKLFVLPDKTLVYCGHGIETTIGEEKLNNPYCGLSSGH